MLFEKKYHFYAAHRNKEANEKCGRIHGHTYEVKCFFKFSKINNDTGVTVLFNDIDEKVEPLIKIYDHWFIIYKEDDLCNILELANEPFIKVSFVTSAENLCVWLFQKIKRETNLPIYKLQLAETKSSTVTYEET